MEFINSYFTEPKADDKWRKLKNRIIFIVTGPFIAFIIIIILSFFIGNYYSKTTPVILFCFY